jgi:hypothetical protein
MRKSSSVARLALAAGLCAGSVLLTGCISASDSQHAEFLNNPTPTIKTLAEVPAEISNRRAKTLDIDFRRMNMEIDDFFLLDRPRRGGYPIPY